MPAAPSVTDRKARHVRRAVLRIDDRTSRHRITWTLEEALRLVHLPGEDEGRVYHFRRLTLPALPAEASRTLWIERLQQTLSAHAHNAIHGADPRSHTADAVFFHDEDEALETILQSALHPNSRPAWFWPAATGITEPHRTITAATILDRIRSTHSPQTTAAIILAASASTGPAPLLAAIPTFTLRDWLRTLEIPSTPLTDAQPITLPAHLTAALQAAALDFGYTDLRTLWLATQAILSISPTNQPTGTALRRATATLRQMETSASRTSTQPTPPHTERAHPSTPAPLPTLVFHDEAIAPTPAGTLEAIDPSLSAPPRTAIALRGEHTEAAGLYFLLHVLRHLGIAQTLEACPALADANFPAHILHALATHAQVNPTDRILSTLPTESSLDEPSLEGYELQLVHKPTPQTGALAPEGTPAPQPIPKDSRFEGYELQLVHKPTPLNGALAPEGISQSQPQPPGLHSTNPDHLLRLCTLAVRRWCWHTAHIPARDIIRRPGLIWLTRTDLDITLALSSVDLRIRRLGLDIDPGWLPWFGPLGLVVRFHYRDRLDSPGGAPC